MNARTETIAGLGTHWRRPEKVELHPARGILAAVGVSIALWVAAIALVVTVWR